MTSYFTEDDVVIERLQRAVTDVQDAWDARAEFATEDEKWRMDNRLAVLWSIIHLLEEPGEERANEPVPRPGRE